MNNSVNFYNSGNGRLIGRAVHDQGWQQTLAAIDRELTSWPLIRLLNHDTIFRWQEDGLWLYRPIIGHLSSSVLAEHGLMSVDFSDRAIAAWHSHLAWSSDIQSLKKWSEDQLKSIQHTDFPEQYGNYDSWQLKLCVSFDGADRANSFWKLEVFFAHGSSSIFAF